MKFSYGVSKRSLTAVLLVLVVSGIGARVYWRLHHQALMPTPVTLEHAKYISFDGNYVFSIPEKSVVDGTSLPGNTIIYPDSLSTINGLNIEQLYIAGAVVVQPITDLKDNNKKTFAEYTNGTLASSLRQVMKSATDVRQAKQGSIEANRIFAITNDGKRLRVVYAVDFTQPIAIGASQEHDLMKVVGSTVEDFQTSSIKPDIDEAVAATKQVISLIRAQDVAAITKMSTPEFRSSQTNEQLQTELKILHDQFQRSAAIAGGTYNGTTFLAQFILAPEMKEVPAARGIISLQKTGQTWSVEAIQSS